MAASVSVDGDADILFFDLQGESFVVMTNDLVWSRVRGLERHTYSVVAEKGMCACCQVPKHERSRLSVMCCWLQAQGQNWATSLQGATW